MAAGKQVTAMLQKFLKVCANSGTLDTALGACKVVSATPGNCVISLVVDKTHSNQGGTLHGGFSAHLVDSITTAALMTNDSSPGVSVNMNLTYMKAAKIGEEILIEAKTVRKGRTLAFLECQIKNKETGALLVTGSHTKFIGG